MSTNTVDIAFDVRSDAGGKDPDSHSATLRRYHRLLWSRPLPNGASFDLDERLHHSSALGDFWLASDAITHTYSNRTRPSRLMEVLQQIPASEVTAFYDLGCTIGAYTVFPYPVQEAGKWRQSINQARGMNGKIGDRFDLTLECIRRYYNGTDSPLTNAFYPYASFFGLFEDFEVTLFVVPGPVRVRSISSGWPRTSPVDGCRGRSGAGSSCSRCASPRAGLSLR